MWSDIVSQEEQAESAAVADVSAALTSLPEPVAAINAAAGKAYMSQVVTVPSDEPMLAAPIPIASLLLNQPTTVMETAVASPGMSAGEPAVASAFPASAAATAPDTHWFLQDADVTYAVRLAPAPGVEVMTDALLTSF